MMQTFDIQFILRGQLLLTATHPCQDVAAPAHSPRPQHPDGQDVLGQGQAPTSWLRQQYARTLLGLTLEPLNL